MQTLTADKAIAQQEYNNADPATKELLRKIFGAQITTDIKERVRSFEDACAIDGTDPRSAKFTTGDPDDIAFQKLKVITRVLNEGWYPDWSNANERKWFSWMQYGPSGFRFDVAYYAYSDTYSTGGSRLCFKSEELAVYAAKQFESIYNDYLK